MARGLLESLLGWAGLIALPRRNFNNLGFILEGWRAAGGSFWRAGGCLGAHLECLGDILGSFGASEGRGSDFGELLRVILGHFRVLLGPLLDFRGGLGVIFGTLG